MNNSSKTQQNIPNGWKLKKLSDVLDYERPDAYIVKNTSYSNKAKTPVLTANKSFILGYTDEDFGIYENVPVIIFDDFTTDSKFVDFPFKIKSSAIKILKCKDESSDLRFVYEKMKLVKFPVANHKRYYISQYQELEMLFPEKEEQVKIADILGMVDEDIAKTVEVIERTEKLKRGLMQQLFTRGIGHTKFKETKIGQIPEGWEIKTFEEFAVLQRGFDLPVQDRQVGQYDLVTSNGVTDTNAEFKVKGPGVVTGRSGTLGSVFYIENNFWPLNTTLYIKDFHGNHEKFVYYKIKSFDVSRFGTGTGVPTLNRNIVHKEIVAVPKYAEQKKIAEILSTVDEKILVNKKLKEKLTLLKKGLMQDLLSGKVRTINLM
jgi:type I restriction enzyme S subunit